MGPGVLLLGLSVRDLCDQLIVTDLEVASAEYLRDDQGPCGLGVYDAATVKLLQQCCHELPKHFKYLGLNAGIHICSFYINQILFGIW